MSFALPRACKVVVVLGCASLATSRGRSNAMVALWPVGADRANWLTRSPAEAGDAACRVHWVPDRPITSSSS